MFRRTLVILIVSCAALIGAGCRKNHVVNPIANLDSKQPDKVLFDRSMKLIQQGKYDTARITLQTLINTYPDSEYIARAKLAVGDSWYAEGNAAALQQAEVEYKDFQTFFPNVPEAAEAQLKVAGIHYKEMEKPDRDYTHAKRAEDEYRQLIQQYPDSKLVPEAKQRLREVQEVLAEREYRIGRFYYLRESYPAAIARLQSLADTYPLYSNADEVLYLLGQSYEAQINSIRARPGNEVAKARLIESLTGKAAEAYSKIIARYPAMERTSDAKARLEALKRPIPTPTPAAIAQNKAEIASRSETSRFGKIMGNFRHSPDLSAAATVGEPTMEDPKETSAPEIVKSELKAAVEASVGKSSVEIKNSEGANTSDAVPHTDATGTGEATPETAATPASEASPAGATPAAPAPAPNQVNDANTDSATVQNDAKSKTDSKAAPIKKDKESSSAKKKKKGLRKLIPF